jgi:CRP-like cAMP-binding protein
MPSESRSRRVPGGTVIFRQGDAGEEMFIIANGHVSFRMGVEGHEREIAVLGPGEFFGELSLLAHMPRTATAVAIEDTMLLAIHRETFALMMQDEIDVVFHMMDALGRRLVRADRHVAEIAEIVWTVRTAAHALARCLAGGDGTLFLDAATIARAADVPVAEAERVIGALVERGVGRFEAGSWALDARADARRLANALAATR